MSALNLVLWMVGAALIGVAAWRIRDPFARMGELDRLAENARRYEAWRGGRGAAAQNETTGADVMRALLRRQVLTWAVVGAAGIALILAGFVVR